MRSIYPTFPLSPPLVKILRALYRGGTWLISPYHTFDTAPLLSAALRRGEWPSLRSWLVAHRASIPGDPLSGAYRPHRFYVEVANRLLRSALDQGLPFDDDLEALICQLVSSPDNDSRTGAAISLWAHSAVAQDARVRRRYQRVVRHAVQNPILYNYHRNPLVQAMVIYPAYFHRYYASIQFGARMLHPFLDALSTELNAAHFQGLTREQWQTILESPGALRTKALPYAPRYSAPELAHFAATGDSELRTWVFAQARFLAPRPQ